MRKVKDLTTCFDYLLGHRVYKVGKTLVTKIYKYDDSGNMVVDTKYVRTK